MSNLYQLNGEIRELEKIVTSGELSPEDIFDTVQSIEAIFETKAIDVAKIIKNIDPTILALKNEVQRLGDRKKSLETRKEKLIDYLRENMQAGGHKEIIDDLITIKLQKERDNVQIDDEDKLPDEYVNVSSSITPDKKAIKKALDEEKKVPGARLVKGTAPLVIK
jgi:hypothetical protein